MKELKAMGKINRKLSIVVPLFNSEKTIESLVDKISDDLCKYVGSIELILVNDGSSDNTDDIVRKLIKKYPKKIVYIKLAKNFSEHNAVMCGLNGVTGDYVVIIDDDFQNPPEEILKLLNKIVEGYDVVYSYYKKKKHSPFRNLGSRFNNWIATKLLNKPKDLYLSSFKILSKNLVKMIIQYKGPFPYVDGLILQSTGNIGTQLCKHEKSARGRSNYSLIKLVKLWLNVFTGFSITPLRIASIIGFTVSGLAVLLMLFFILSYLSGGIFFKQLIPPGWASLIVVVTFFGGIQLILLGIIGEYLGRLFLTVNKIPQFVIEEEISLGKKENYEHE